VCSLACGENAVSRREKVSGESGKIMGTVIRRFVMYNLQSTNCHIKVEQCPQNTGTM
jgi:hypothetical protein